MHEVIKATASVLTPLAYILVGNTAGTGTRMSSR